MKSKKKPEVDIESLRASFTFLGFMIIGSIVTLSFSYKEEVDFLRIDRNVQDIDIPEELVVIEDEPEKIEEPVQIEIEPPIDNPIDLDNNIETTDNRDEVPEIRIDPSSIFIEPVPEPVAPVAPAVKFPDKEASFPGGSVEMHKFLSSRLVYPDISLQLDEQGKVFLEFIVNTDGSIEKIKVLRGVSKEIDAEAIRVIRSMPEWTPAMLNGENVRAYCRISVNFKIEP